MVLLVTLIQPFLLCCCSESDQVVVEQSQAEALAAAAAAGDNLICQAIINSGIALGREEAVVEEISQECEEMDKEVSDCPDVDESIAEIHVKEEFMETETEVRMTVIGIFTALISVEICVLNVFKTRSTISLSF